MAKPQTICECKRCGLQAQGRHALISHLRKKRPCDPSIADLDRATMLSELLVAPIAHHQQQQGIAAGNKHTCHLCTASYKHAASLSRHIRVTHLDPQPQQETPATPTEPLEPVQVTVLHALGDEDMSSLIEHPKYPSFFEECVLSSVHGLFKYLCKKHFSQVRPQNQNVRKTNKRDNMVEYFDGQYWRHSTNDSILDKLFNRIHADLKRPCFRPDTDLGSPRVIESLMQFSEHVARPLGWPPLEYASQGRTIDDLTLQRRKRRIYRMANNLIYVETKNSGAHCKTT